MRRDVVALLMLATAVARAESPPPPPLSIYTVFDGQAGAAGTAPRTPDPGGGAGPTHVIDVVNGVITVRDNGSGATVMTSTADTFWTAAGVTGTPAASSQHATFNAENQRWYISAEEGGSGPNRLYLAVSASASALGPWKAVTLPAQSAAISNTQLAVDPCGAYISGDMGTSGVVMALPFADLHWSGVSAPTATHLNVLAATAGIVAAIDPWNRIASNARMFVARTPGTSSKIDVYKLHWASPVCSSTLSATLAPPVSVDLGVAYPAPSRAAVQPSPAPGLAAGNGAIASAASSNGEIVGIATTESAGQLGAIWFQVYADPTSDVVSLQQVGTIVSPGADLIAPAIAFSPYSGIGMVLVRTSASDPPSIYVTAQPRGDQLGSTQPLMLARGGTDAYSCAPTANVSAFGRYSSIAHTATGFWAVAQYGASSTACEFGTAWVNFGVEPAPVYGDLTSGSGDEHGDDVYPYPDDSPTGCVGCSTGGDARTSIAGSILLAFVLLRRRRARRTNL